MCGHKTGHIRSYTRPHRRHRANPRTPQLIQDNGSGLTTEINYAAVYTFRGGKVLTVKEYNTFAEALETLGLKE